MLTLAGLLLLGLVTLLALVVGLSVWWPSVEAAPGKTIAPTPAAPPATETSAPSPTPPQTQTPNPSPTTSAPPTARPPAASPTPPAPTAVDTPEPAPTRPESAVEGATATREAQCRGMVMRTGDRLTLDGKEFQFLGTNMAYLLESYFPEEEIEPILAFVGETFPNAVLRVWLLPGFDLDRFERVLDLGGEHGVRFLVTLDDYYRDKGEWWFQSAFRMEYLPHVRQVVEQFRDRPEIAVWELMNEPGCGKEGDSQPCLDAEYGWVKETSEAIKALDPCRPVSIGTINASPWSPAGMDNFRRMHALPSVDMVSVHKEVGAEVATAVRIAGELGKPWFVGEAYYRVYDDRCQPIRTELLGQRADAVEADIRASLDNRASGYLLWQYAAGPVNMGDKIQWFCGWYEYFRDDPTHLRIRAADWGLDLQ